MPQFCRPGESGGNSVPCNGTLSYACMQNSTALFWPKSDKHYLDLEKLIQVEE